LQAPNIPAIGARRRWDLPAAPIPKPKDCHDRHQGLRH
jgi:hypothetical protein